MGIWNLADGSEKTVPLSDTVTFFWKYSDKFDKLYCFGAGGDLYTLDPTNGNLQKVRDSTTTALILGVALDDKNGLLYVSALDFSTAKEYIQVISLPSGQSLGQAIYDGPDEVTFLVGFV